MDTINLEGIKLTGKQIRELAISGKAEPKPFAGSYEYFYLWKGHTFSFRQADGWYCDPLVADAVEVDGVHLVTIIKKQKSITLNGVRYTGRQLAKLAPVHGKPVYWGHYSEPPVVWFPDEFEFMLTFRDNKGKYASPSMANYVEIVPFTDKVSWGKKIVQI